MVIRTVAATMWAGVLVWTMAHRSLDGHMPDGLASAQVIPTWYAVARMAPATPVQLSRVLAMVHVAMHDAVNGADPRYETYASDLIDRRAHPLHHRQIAAARPAPGGSRSPSHQERPWPRARRSGGGR